jgi:hypothetical protein
VPTIPDRHWTTVPPPLLAPTSRRMWRSRARPGGNSQPGRRRGARVGGPARPRGGTEHRARTTDSRRHEAAPNGIAVRVKARADLSEIPAGEPTAAGRQEGSGRPSGSWAHSRPCHRRQLVQLVPGVRSATARRELPVSGSVGAGVGVHDVGQRRGSTGRAAPPSRSTAVARRHVCWPTRGRCVAGDRDPWWMSACWSQRAN